MKTKRTVHIQSIDVNSVTFSSILSIGDTKKAHPTSRAIAVQQPSAVFNAHKEVTYADYPIFSRKPKWIQQSPSVQKNTFHHQPYIRTKNIFTIAVNGSSIFQLGSLQEVKADSRTKHIRKIRKHQNP
ncbi:spore germination protein GerPE [Virgibacillus soli]|uniref:Spore germination protein GerPE n=1 Tax=Paracerasibacillus soli TaxID=480284 RepID=A0ABU5CNB6_9BACI|nr:spore germination protein GerPE [Virgibacillus soli]MDY0407853.1 spore germination protein GerPE [Virgibacillus soli]